MVSIAFRHDLIVSSSNKSRYVYMPSRKVHLDLNANGHKKREKPAAGESQEGQDNSFFCPIFPSVHFCPFLACGHRLLKSESRMGKR